MKYENLTIERDKNVATVEWVCPHGKTFRSGAKLKGDNSDHRRIEILVLTAKLGIASGQLCEGHAA